ncbi:MAG: DUF234 domain-containing protein [Lachnospiraceae bacterium]|nr:DUF234 domain-containing protein [Lachnospiraceae bacterium]
MYRKKDLQFLQDIYDRPSNDIALLYGDKSYGLIEVITDLMRDKDCLYYRARAVDDTTQKLFFARALHEQTRTPVFPEDDYERLIGSYINEHTDRKKLIILDDFSYLIKENPTFVNFLTSLLSDRSRLGSAMFLLVSDDSGWVENDMLRIIGRRSSEISGVLKLRPYTPAEFAACFPKMPYEEMIGIYSFAGGKCAIYNDITEKTTLRDMVVKYLAIWSSRDFDPDSYLPREIREPQVYNTILVNLAAGMTKPKDLHKATGTDRAKLAVYLKKLMEYDIVEKKINEAAAEASDSRKAGIYVIKDQLIRFYYRYVYANASLLQISGPERFYRRYIEHGIDEFTGSVYPLFCMDHIRYLQREGRLTFKLASVEEYNDRYDAIDFIIVAAGGSVIACACKYGTAHMTHKTYEDVRASVRKNRLMCDNIWLFSSGGFDQKLVTMEGETPGLKLIEGKDQRLH